MPGHRPALTEFLDAAACLSDASRFYSYCCGGSCGGCVGRAGGGIPGIGTIGGVPCNGPDGVFTDACCSSSTCFCNLLSSRPSRRADANDTIYSNPAPNKNDRNSRRPDGKCGNCQRSSESCTSFEKFWSISIAIVPVTRTKSTRMI